MNNYILYILESTASLLVLYVAYQVFLKRLSSFHFNRSYILFSVFASLVIPTIDFTVFDNSLAYAINLSPITIYANGNETGESSGSNLVFWLELLYFFIAGILLLKFLIQLATIIKLGYSARKTQSPLDQNTIFISPRESFSFFYWIFIRQEDLGNTAIYFHEKQHAKYWHSMDIVLLKLVQIAFWFNPFLFLFEKELRLQHEYAVDSMVLRSGTKKNHYRQLLLNQLFNTEFNLITNNFNQTFLKNRFIMMTKKENKKVSKLLLLALMSLVIISPLAISCSMETDETTIDETVNIAIPETPTKVEEPTKQTETVPAKEESSIYTVVDEMPLFPGGEQAMYTYVNKNIHYPEEAKKAGVSGRIFLSFVVEKDGSLTEIEVLRGIGSGCDEAALEVIRSMPRWKPGKQRGQAVRVKYRMPIKFSLN